MTNENSQRLAVLIDTGNASAVLTKSLMAKVARWCAATMTRACSKSRRMVWLCLALSVSAAQAGMEPWELKASLAFAAAPHQSAKAADQYLLVYSSNEARSGSVIYGRALNPDGSPLGRDFRLSTELGLTTKPVLAYNAQTTQFLVVWGRYTEGKAEIRGLNVALNGRIVGEEFLLTSSGLYDTRPAIAYCPGRNRFLVTWSRSTGYDFDEGVSDIYGQFVGGDGSSLQGENFAIASDAKNQFKSDVSCDVVNDRFLIVWEDQRNLATQDDIYAQLMSSDGTLLGGNYLFAGSAQVERRPVVSANTRAGGYLVVWESIEEAGVRLYSQTVDLDGKLRGTPIAVGADLGGQRNRAAVDYLKQQDVFLVVFDNTGFDNVGDGIWGQFVNSSGALRDVSIPVTTALQQQYRPGVAAARESFLAVWTDYRNVAGPNPKQQVYEYFGRVIGNDMALSSRWRNPNSR